MRSTYRNKHKRYNLKKFGLTIETYQALLEAQGGKCKICRGVSKRSLAVDHDHVSGRIRGLLCPSCNVGLGMFKDNKSLLSAAIGYLE